MHTALTHLSPDAALVVLTIGLLLIYIELNRPGLIVFGAVGLLTSLLAIASLYQWPWERRAILLILVAIVAFGRVLRRATSKYILIGATICLTDGFFELITAPSAPHIHLFSALPCGILLGAATSVLARIAHRARINKGLPG